MLLQRYKKEMIRPKCNPSFQDLRCIAHLEQDISKVLPYLNSTLGGHQFSKDPLSLTIKLYGKTITLHPKEIAISSVKDESEADKILKWLKEEINKTWKDRKNIEPKFEIPPKPQVINILKFLPKTNCKKCGVPTCIVFAVQMSEGARSAEQCPELDENQKMKLKEYLKQFPGF